MYQIRLTIGDWSRDGHGQSEVFCVKSNFPVERIREAHFHIEETTGINIEEICSDYGEEEIGSETLTKLKSMGFHFENASGMGEAYISVPEMAKLWVFLLQKADPELQMEIMSDEEIPLLQFYGFDEQGRHISGVGYGLFE